MDLLTIVADDFGVNPSRTDGIIECFAQTKGSVPAHASLLLNGIDSARAVGLAKLCKLPLALHLNMTEGAPTCTDDVVLNSPLVDPQTKLFRGKQHFIVEFGFSSNPVVMDAMVAEIVAQLQRFTEVVGTSPQRIDGHHHIQVLPTVFTALQLALHRVPDNIRVALKTIRVGFDPTLQREAQGRVLQEGEMAARLESGSWITAKECFGWPFWGWMSFLGQKIVVDAQSPFQNVSTQRFVGYDLMGNSANMEALKGKLNKIRAENPNISSVELMTHIGHAVVGIPTSCPPQFAYCFDEFARSDQRDHELSLYSRPLAAGA